MAKKKSQPGTGGGANFISPPPLVERDGMIGADDNNLYDYRNRRRPYPKKPNLAAGEARAAVIRALPGAELEAFCLPAELPGELSRRFYFGQMNQVELEFQATFDKDAEAELKRRLGELPR